MEILNLINVETYSEIQILKEILNQKMRSLGGKLKET